MIIVLSYFLDGGGKPEIEFFPDRRTQSVEVAKYLANDVQFKTVEIYEITNPSEYPVKVYPKDTPID